MAENLALRALISQQTDALVSELYTDDKVNERLQKWLVLPILTVICWQNHANFPKSCFIAF